VAAVSVSACLVAVMRSVAVELAIYTRMPVNTSSQIKLNRGISVPFAVCEPSMSVFCIYIAPPGGNGHAGGRSWRAGVPCPATSRRGHREEYQNAGY
jgi:hypothetical protein